jgi:hypothetical protein
LFNNSEKERSSPGDDNSVTLDNTVGVVVQLQLYGLYLLKGSVGRPWLEGYNSLVMPRLCLDDLAIVSTHRTGRLLDWKRMWLCHRQKTRTHEKKNQK